MFTRCNILLNIEIVHFFLNKSIFSIFITGHTRNGSETPSLPHVHQPKYKCHHCNKSLDGMSIYGLETSETVSMQSSASKPKKSIEVKMPPVKKTNEDPEALPHAHTTSGPCYFCSEHKEDYEKLERYQPTWRAKVSFILFMFECSYNVLAYYNDNKIFDLFFFSFIEKSELLNYLIQALLIWKSNSIQRICQFF